MLKANPSLFKRIWHTILEKSVEIALIIIVISGNVLFWQLTKESGTKVEKLNKLLVDSLRIATDVTEKMPPAAEAVEGVTKKMTAAAKAAEGVTKKMTAAAKAAEKMPAAATKASEAVKKMMEAAKDVDQTYSLIETHLNNLYAQLEQLELSPLKNGEEWNGLKIAAENRCESYNRRKYRYNKKTILKELKKRCNTFYAPYSDKFLQSRKGMNIGRIVAPLEAHDSGLCAATKEKREDFSNNPINFTLVSRNVNKRLKNNNDVGEWLPRHNQCWYAWRVVTIKQKYELTVDPQEATALKRLWEDCDLQVDAEPPEPPLTSCPASLPEN